MSAKQRYDKLTSDRSQFLDVAKEASRLTLPYLIKGDDDYNTGARVLRSPWQSVGAKSVVTLASKLMLALLPTQGSWFKLQLDEATVQQEFPPEIKSELDLSFSKIERMINESIAASDDRVVVNQALKHLVVAGNALIFMGKEGLKLYPLNRYALERDGNGTVIEIVTRERINRELLAGQLIEAKPNSVSSETDQRSNNVDIYTHVKREGNSYIWHQEVDGVILPKSTGKAPIDATPWLVLRMNYVDGEVYGRGRVEEFMGDLKSLEALSQALVEGSAAAAKVIFTVNPSSTTKPATLERAANGAIVSGRPDDIGVVQVGKTADFKTAYEMMLQLEKRISDAFLVMQVRNSERTTAEEVRMTQMELEAQLGGLFSMLTVEFLVPYLNRKMLVFQKTGEIPKIPKGIVKPTIVAGLNALGRGQDSEQLTIFITTLAQTMGPEAIAQFINQDEYIKRLAASQGIDYMGLIKSQEQMQGEMQQQQQQAQQMELTKQASKISELGMEQQQLEDGQDPTNPANQGQAEAPA